MSRGQMKRVGLLYDSVSRNTGDIAIGIAVQQGLSARGITSVIVDPFDYNVADYSCLIVGGGQLLRDPGDTFYDAFRARGKHILNSVGLGGDKDFHYLKEYRYISARSNAEAKILERDVKLPVTVLPCTTTILESKPYAIPGLNIKPGEKVVGIHLVPDIMMYCPDIIEIINAIPHKKVFIPFTHYNHDASFMHHLPLDKRNAIMLDKLNPLQLHSVISQMSYVIVSSLHATLFAYSQNVPFISMYQEKTLNYFKDRRLGKYIFKNQTELTGLIETVENEPPRFNAAVERDKKAVNEALDAFTGIIGASVEKSDSPVNAKKVDTKLQRLSLENKQLYLAITKRDVLIHNIIYHGMRSSDAKVQALQQILIDTQQEVGQLRQQLQYERDKKILDRLVDRIKQEIRREQELDSNPPK